MLQKTCNTEAELAHSISRGNANPHLNGAEGDSFLCQAQLIPAEQTQRGRVASRGASGKVLVSQRKAAPSAPADPAPSAAQNPATGTAISCRDCSAVRGSSRVKKQRQDKERGYDLLAPPAPSPSAAG